jgi:membrane associated rhomboid family serine protease
MAFLCRHRTLASLPVNKFLDPWSLVVLRSSVSTAACQRSVPHEYFLPATTVPPVPKRRPQPAPKYDARSLLLRPLQSHGMQVRQFGLVSVSTRFPTCGPLHHCGGGLLLSRSSHSPTDVLRTPSRKSRASPTPGDPLPPHAQSTERAVCYIIGINFAVSCAWWFSLSRNTCFREKCTDNKCEHEYSGPYQWMLKNTTYSKDNIQAHRYWTIVTAAFSQILPRHLLWNMLQLTAFAFTFCKAGGVGIGASHVVRLTLGSAVVSNVTRMIYRWDTPAQQSRVDADGPKAKQYPHGLGASGVVSAFANSAACLRPKSRFGIGRFRFPSWMLYLAMDRAITDLVSVSSDESIGHDVHLAGAVFGIVYYLVALRKPYGVW